MSLVYTEETPERRLERALDRFLATKSVPSYLREAAEMWLMEGGE